MKKLNKVGKERSLPVYRGPGVYGIINEVDDKAYVGSALCVRGRLSCHRSQLRRGVHGNPYLQRAWNKYGEKNFRFDLLEKCEAEDVLAREKRWMEKLKTTDRFRGYNIALDPTSGPMLGKRHTVEAKAKMSATQVGRDPACYLAGALAGAAAMHKKGHSKETRKKISKAHKGKKMSAAHRAAVKANHWSKGPHAKEITARFAAKLRGRKLSKEHKDKIAEGMAESIKFQKRDMARDARLGWIKRRLGYEDGQPILNADRN